MFKRLINSSSKTITSAAIIIGALSLVSRLLGIFRDRILAGEFGAGDILDVYYAAFRLPDLVFNLLVLGAISAGLIPVFTGLLNKSHQKFKKKMLMVNQENEAWELVSNVLNILILLLAVASVILFIFTPQLMRVMTPGFSGAKMDLLIGLTRLMYVSPILLGVSSIFGSVLQSFKRFFVYSLAPIFYNIGIIIGVLYLVDYFGIYGLAYGVILGSVMHMTIQLIAVVAMGYRHSWRFNFKDKNTCLIGKLMVPRTLTLIMNQINILVITVVASTLAAGSLAVFNLANNLQSFPLGIIGVSFAIGALPTLSVLAAKNKTKEFADTISHTFRQVLFFIVPISILLYVLRAQVVRIILGSGNFDWIDTRLTAACLAIFVLSLFAQGTIPLVVRGFYAYKDSKTPFIIGLFSMAVNVGALLFFRFVYSYDNWFSYATVAILKVPDLWHQADLRVLALPMAVSISSVFNLGVLMIWLRRKIGELDGGQLAISIFKIFIASLGTGLFAYAALQIMDKYVATHTFFGILVQGTVAGLVGLLGYWLIAYVLKMEEMNIFISSMRKKLFKVFGLYDESVSEDVMG